VQDQMPEEALKATTGEQYKGGHYAEPNVLAHIRFNERTDVDGKRVLFVEEIQSDFGAAMRKGKQAIQESVDSDFQGIIKRMEEAGVIQVECD